MQKNDVIRSLVEDGELINNDETKATYETTELQQSDYFGTVSGKAIAGVLLTLKSNVAPNYKHMLE